MKVDMNNRIIEMKGFDIGNMIFISDSNEVTFSEKEDGEYKKAKQIRVIMSIETLISWIDDTDLLEEIGIDVW